MKVRNRVAKIFSLCICAIIIIQLIGLSSQQVSANANDITSIAKIKRQDIIKQVHYKKILQEFKSREIPLSSSSEFIKYLGNLDFYTLMLTMAEFGYEFDKTNDVEGFIGFQSQFPRILKTMNKQQYLIILNSKEFPNTFKYIMSDLLQTSYKMNNKKLDKDINDNLRKIIIRNQEAEFLLMHYIELVDNYAKSDSIALKKLLAANNHSSHYKYNILLMLAKADINECLYQVKSILDNYKKNTIEEFDSAMELLLNIHGVSKLKNSPLEIKAKNLIVTTSTIIFKTSDKVRTASVIKGLTGTKDKNCLMLLADNIEKAIGDIKFEVLLTADQEVILSMIDIKNDKNTIKAGLKLVEKSKSIYYLEGLKLLIQHKDNDIRTEVEKLIDGIEDLK